MAWRIRFDAAAERDLSRLDKPIARRITAFLRERLAPLENPRSLGEALRGDRLGAFWKYRVGDYRIIASIEDNAVCVFVVRVSHRREAYR